MAKARVTAKRTQLTLKTYTHFPGRQLPLIFQETYGNIYPDTRDDVLGGPVKKVKYDAIILENPHIRVTIIPDLGGKIWSVYDKHARREALHVPSCIKPGMVMTGGAWIPGGMEINFPIGHHVDSMFPLPAHIAEDGPDRAVAIVERRCRRTGMRLEARTILKADEACFDLSITVSNPTPISQRWYQWTNVGVTASKDWRFFAKGNLYTGGMGIDTYPVDKSGKDISWYKNRAGAGDNFMVGVREDYFGCYDYGKEHGLAHWAPWQDLPGKKYFTWGGTLRSYDSEHNFDDNGQDYLEIQTGPMETQSHFALLGPGESKCFTGTWMPYRQIGGLEWACRSLLFNVRDGAAWVYATTAVDAEISINGKTRCVQMAAGEIARLRGRVRDGDRIEITVNSRKERSFTYPLEGRMEPNARQRCLKEQNLFTAAGLSKVPDSASGALAVARQLVKSDFPYRAVTAYRKALAFRPALHEARLELAEALMRMGDFAAADKELAQLLRTRVAGKARQLLERREAIEQAFLAPVLAQPAGPKRDLAMAERYAGYGAFDLAARICKKLLKSDPRNARVHFAQAMYLWQVKKNLNKAIEHADRALQRKAGDRDLLIELCPLYQQAGRHERVIEEIAKAAPAVRKMAILQKYLVAAYFETGQLSKSWKIMTTVRLYNWEGELSHVATYVDCALGLAEQALSKGDIAGARHYVDMAADPSKPQTLGVLRDCGGKERMQYWTGLVALHEGKRREAERIWREAVEPARNIKRLPLDISEWHLPPNPENDYMRAMCAAALGDAKAVKHMIRLVQRLRDDWIKKDSEYRPAPVDLLNGLVAELQGDFKAAATAFKRHVEKAPYKQMARMHLKAAEGGRMRGQALAVCRTAQGKARRNGAGA